MPHDLISNLNLAAGRLIEGVLLMSADHPCAMALILAGLAGAAGAVLLDTLTVGPRRR